MELIAQYTKTLWTNYKYTIALFRTSDLEHLPDSLKPTSNTTKSVSVVVKGNDVPTYSNMSYVLNGKWEQDKKSNRLNFSLDGAYIVQRPTNRKAIVAFLSSEMFKGIGPTLAQRVVNKFGSATLEVINKEPKKLLEVPGITESRLSAIVVGYKEAAKYQSVATALGPYGVSMNLVKKIVDKFDIFAMDEIRKNPYCLIDNGLAGFATCDKINLQLEGHTLNSPERIRACIKVSIKGLCANQGGTFVTDTDLKTYVIRELNKLVVNNNEKVTPELYDKTFEKMRNDKEIVVRNNKFVYPYIFDVTERNVAIGLLKLNENPIDVKEQDIVNSINEYVSKQEYPLSKRQQAAVRNALLKRVSVITGGPGTGKTTIIKCIISVYRKVFKNQVVCMAPTGKASRRMAEATGEEAKTIHSRLRIVDEFSSTPPERIEEGLVIIDETSMVDNALMSKIVDALSPNCMLLMVGDIDQLPSVGVGQVLNDIINSNIINTSRLTEVFRQKGGSTIIDNAMKINTGYTNLIYDDNFIFVPVRNEQEAQNKIIEIYGKEVATWGIDQVALLCPLRRTQQGRHNCTSDGLNPILKERANSSKDKDFVRYEDKIYTVGDRIMQWKNKEHSSNGDIGEIVEIIHDENDGDICVVNWDNGYKEKVSVRDFDTIDYAYAMSIHKSQGSEYNSVIIPIISAQFCPLFKRNLLYTGVTRAKKKVIIVGDKYAIDRCIKAADTSTRKTLLTARLKYNAQQLTKNEEEVQHD